MAHLNFVSNFSTNAQINNQILPIVFGLLLNKNENTFNRFFSEVRNVVRNIGHDPSDVLIDFEKAAVNAISTDTTDGNIWKHIQEARLQARYTTDNNFAKHLKVIRALAFVPPDDVIATFDQLADEIRNHYNGDVDVVLDYFEEHYVGRYRRNAPRAEPRSFPFDLWNMFRRTEDELSRTKGWHRGYADCN